MTWIVDTSVALKWVVAEQGSDAAAAFIGDTVVAPDLLRSELGNALCKKVVRREIGAVQAVAAFAEIESLLTFLPTDGLGGRALDIALALNHPVYDCVYLALAETTGMTVLTADRKFAIACRDTEFAGRVVQLDSASAI